MSGTGPDRSPFVAPDDKPVISPEVTTGAGARYHLYPRVLGFAHAPEVKGYSGGCVKRVSCWQERGTIRILLPAFLMFLLVYSPAQAEEPFRVGVIDVPGGFLSVSDGRLEGRLASLYRCVFTRSDVDAQFLSVPLQRGWFYLERDQLDALFPLAMESDRNEIAHFGGELFRSEYAFVTTKPIPTLPRGLRYGLMRGSVGRALIPDSASVVEEVTRGAQLVPMLERDRIDVAVMPTILAEQLAENRAGELFVQPAGSLPVSMYLTAEPENAERSRNIIRAIGECRI